MSGRELLVLGFFLMIAGLGLILLVQLRADPPSATVKIPGAPTGAILNLLRPPEIVLGQEMWRWAREDETFDVYVPAPEHGAGAERGIAPWRVNAQGKERRDADVEWVRLQWVGPGYWYPARSDLDAGRIVVFDGFEVRMASVPAGGRAVGLIRPGDIEPLPSDRVSLTGSPHWDDQLPAEIRARLERGEAVRHSELPEGLR